MPLIHTYTPATAQGRVKEVYDQIQAAFGSVPNAMQIDSSSPAQLTRHWESISYYMQHPTLSFNLLAFMRMLISEKTHCEYCVDLNEAMLVNMGGISHDQVIAARKNPQDAPLSDKDKSMLLFVLKATSNSLSVGPADIEALKAQGWSDGEILDGLHHGADMVASDIILNAMKVEKDM